jgi:NAD(P)-dependent dehydrogenase (short-subunit alcohol dehydrogenase family)
MGNVRDLEDKLVVLVGGSGFFGSHLAQELLERGARLRVCSRHVERGYAIKALGNLGQVQFLRVNVQNERSLAAAFLGADAVVNLVGAFKGNLDAVQGQGAGRVAALAAPPAPRRLSTFRRSAPMPARPSPMPAPRRKAKRPWPPRSPARWWCALDPVRAGRHVPQPVRQGDQPVPGGAGVRPRRAAPAGVRG